MRAVTRCDDVRQDLCRLAVGGEPSEPPEILARHARDCSPCRDYADDLAGVSRWLELWPAARERGSLGADDALVRRACLALERELGARLARDLLELGQGRPRDPARRRLDLLRLLVLSGGSALRRPLWRATLRLLTGRRAAVDCRGALRLALQLDPLGLDVALAYLSQLEKEGRRREADEVADRLIGQLQ